MNSLVVLIPKKARDYGSWLRDNGFMQEPNQLEVKRELNDVLL